MAVPTITASVTASITELIGETPLIRLLCGTN